MTKLKKEVYTTYDAEFDRTIIWMDLYIEKESRSPADIQIKPIQTAILGWYYGVPNATATEQFSNSTIIAQYT